MELNCEILTFVNKYPNIDFEYANEYIVGYPSSQKKVIALRGKCEPVLSDTKNLIDDMFSLAFDILKHVNVENTKISMQIRNNVQMITIKIILE